MDYQVISADDHIDLRWLPKDLWTERLPQALKERGPRVQEADGSTFWFCDGRKWGPWGTYTAAQGSGAKWAIEAAGLLQEGVLRPTTPELRLADMDRDGVGATVMYGPTDPLAVDDPELRLASYSAYNDWLEEFCSAKPDRLLGVAQLPLEDPRAARQELARVAKLGARHVNVLAARATPPVFDEAWEPFWAVAEETGIPVGFHLAVEVKGIRETGGTVSPMVTSAVSGAMVGLQLLEPITGLIFMGVLDRYPRLKLVMAEAGIAWIPHLIQSLDNTFERMRSGRRLVDGTGARLIPSEYFRRQIWITFQDDAAGLHMLPLLDVDKIMWASDYPHPASTFPNSQRIIEQQTQGLPEAVCRKILADNARQLYGL